MVLKLRFIKYIPFIFIFTYTFLWVPINLFLGSLKQEKIPKPLTNLGIIRVKNTPKIKIQLFNSCFTGLILMRTELK